MYRLYHGDCLDMLDQLESQSVDLVLADIPYGTTQCKWDQVIPLDQMWKAIDRVAKRRAARVLFSDEPFASFLRVSNIKQYKYDWTWDKVNRVNGHLNAKKQPLFVTECICVFYRSSCVYNPQMVKGSSHKHKFAKQAGKEMTPIYRAYENTRRESDGSLRYPRNLISVKAQYKTVHPTQKPVALLEYLIRTYSNPGDVVLDFTMGSGSTGEAAANTGRAFIGVELYPLADKPIDKKLNPNYFFDAEQRIRDAYARARAEQRQLEMQL